MREVEFVRSRGQVERLIATIMARRGATESQPLYADSDSGDSTEPDTPKQARPGSRRRISDGIGLEPSLASPDRPPLKSVINDDAAEKRRRRKSNKFTAPTADNAEAGPSENAPPPRLNKTRQLKSIAALPVQPLEIKESNFEEWMKMATDNVRLTFISPAVPICSLDTHRRKSMPTTRGASP